MGFLDGIKKLTQPFDDEDDFYDDDEMETPIPVETPSGNYEQPERKSSFFSGSNENIQQQAERPYASNPSPRPRRESRINKVVDLGTGGQHMKVVLINPENFEAAAEIADQLRDRRPVLMNLENTPKDVSRRLIDFLSGVAYALEGKIKRVATNAYIITPYNVDLMGENAGEIDGNSLRF